MIFGLLLLFWTSEYSSSFASSNQTLIYLNTNATTATKTSANSEGCCLASILAPVNFAPANIRFGLLTLIFQKELNKIISKLTFKLPPCENTFLW